MLYLQLEIHLSLHRILTILSSLSSSVGTCDMLVLGRGMGSIGPWRADVDGMTDGCVGWDKSETDADDWIINMVSTMMCIVFYSKYYAHLLILHNIYVYLLLHITGTCL